MSQQTGGVLAFERTCHSYKSDTDRIRASGIKFDEDEDWYTGTGTPGNGQYNLRGVALHEFGHMTGWQGPSNDGIGAGHFDPDSDQCDGPGEYHTMCPSPAGDGSGWKDLADHDRHTFNAAYPDPNGPQSVVELGSR